MSKLRADITYSHRLKSNDTSEFTISDIDINELFINQNRENNNTADDDNTSIGKNNEIPTEEESDDEIDQTDTENEFNNYLQGWEDMLKEEEADYEEDDADSDDSDNSNNLGNNSNIVDNIVHPAIDTNAKWILVNLFKNNLKLPF